MKSLNDVSAFFSFLCICSHNWSWANHGIQCIYSSLRTFVGTAGDNIPKIVDYEIHVFLQSIQITETELEQCFDFIGDGEGLVDVKKWVKALESLRVKSVAASVIANIHEGDCGSNGPQHDHQRSPVFHKQQDLQCVPSQEYWMVKGGGEVKVFEWCFIERRRWADPVDVWLRAQEVGGLGQTKSRLFVVPMKQTTKGLMKQWQQLKLANDNNSHDLGIEQLKQILRICRISATEAEIKKIFEAADEDGSGTIDSHEFLSIVKSLQAAGGSTGVDSGLFVNAVCGPSPALSVVLACTHKRVLESAGDSGQAQCMFHVQFHENERRSCELLVNYLWCLWLTLSLMLWYLHAHFVHHFQAQTAMDFVCRSESEAHRWVAGACSPLFCGFDFKM